MAKQPSFLYIEDHPASRRVMMLMLEEVMGYSVTILENSMDVVTKLDAAPQPFDIVFLDLNVEPIGGLELASQLRQHSCCAAARIVAVTASVTSSEMKAVRAAGFDGLISKPISPTQFPNQVERLLAGEVVWEVE